MSIPSIPGLPARQIFDSMPDGRKISLLYEAIERVWASMVTTDQALHSDDEKLKRGIQGDLERLSQRMKAMEDRTAT